MVMLWLSPACLSGLGSSLGVNSRINRFFFLCLRKYLLYSPFGVSAFCFFLWGPDAFDGELILTGDIRPSPYIHLDKCPAVSFAFLSLSL